MTTTNDSKRKMHFYHSNYTDGVSNIVERVLGVDNPNQTIVSALRNDYDDGKEYMVLNERYTITNDHKLYRLFTRCTVLSNNLYNAAMSIERDRFLKEGKIYLHQELKQYIYDCIEVQRQAFLPYRESLVVSMFNALPKCVRLGTVYDLADRWYKFLNDEYLVKEYYKRNCNRVSASLIEAMAPVMPRKKKGENRRRSFTIDPNKIKVRNNPQYVNKYRKKQFSRTGSRNTIENYQYLIQLPKEILSAITYDNTITEKDLVIPCKQRKVSILEVRVTPNRGRFNIDIKYRVQRMTKKYEKGYYSIDRDRIAGIDFGLDNLMAVANNVGAAPLLINGKSLVAKNTYYNNLINNCKEELKKYSHRVFISKRIKALEKRRLNIMHNTMNHAVKNLIDYLEVISCRTLVLGISDSLYNGFLSDAEIENFSPVDFEYLVNRISSACRKSNIDVISVNEYYTSTTSILDNRLPTKENSEPYRRVTNRLFMTQNFGIVNCDVNSAMQIICRYKKDAFVKILRHCNVGDIMDKDLSGVPIIKKTITRDIIYRRPNNLPFDNEYCWSTMGPIDDYYIDPINVPYSIIKQIPYNIFMQMWARGGWYKRYKKVHRSKFLHTFLASDVDTNTILYSKSRPYLSRRDFCKLMYIDYLMRTNQYTSAKIERIFCLRNYYHCPERYFHSKLNTAIIRELKKLGYKETVEPMLKAKGTPMVGMLQPVKIEPSDQLITDQRIQRICPPRSFMDIRNSQLELKHIQHLINEANDNNGITQFTYPQVIRYR